MNSLTALSSAFSSGACRHAGWLRPLLPRGPLPLLLACGLLCSGPAARAEKLIAGNTAQGDAFGATSAVLGGTAVIGATGKGAAYLFTGLNNFGFPAPISYLLPTDALADSAIFGDGVSLNGDTAIVGAWNAGGGKGAAYLFRDLNGFHFGSIYSSTKLTASDASAQAYFGSAISQFANTALVAASGGASIEGAVYLYRNLDTAPAAVTQNVKLTASDGSSPDHFGRELSLLGNTGLIGAEKHQNRRGTAYLFRNLNLASGTVTESARLNASDGVADDYFGMAPRLSGNSALVGAGGALDGRGAAYLFRNINTATGTTTETAKLSASDGVDGAAFGYRSSFSGSACLIGSQAGAGGRSGAYFFRNLDTATGSIQENVRLTTTGAVDGFGGSVALDGDRFVIGAPAGAGPVAQSGCADSGLISTFTLLDAGAATRATEGLSFASREDWVIGQSTDANVITIMAGDSGRVEAPGKGVYVGRAAGADQNRLLIPGSLLAGPVQVGAPGNSGNLLHIPATGTVATTSAISVAAGSTISGDGLVEGNIILAPGAFWGFQSDASLTVLGGVSLPSSFGIPSLQGLDGSTPAGAHRLLDGTDSNFASQELNNWGQANAHDIGNGKIAWLAQHDTILQVVVVTGTAPAPLPALHITRGGGNQFTLSWTTDLTGLIPETNPALTGPWQTIPTAPVQSGSNYTLTLPITAPRAYYRLRRP